MPQTRRDIVIRSAAVLLALLAGACLSACKKPVATAKPPANIQRVARAATSTVATPPIYVGLPHIAASSTLQPRPVAGFEPLPCFTYHYVHPKLKNDLVVRPKEFEAQLKMLATLGYHSITARDLAEYHAHGTPLPDKPVMLTFDDGWRSQFTHAWPLLKKYGFRATFFINPQPISQEYEGYMTRNMLVVLARAGNDIESHTWRHLRLTRTRDEDPARYQRHNIKELELANDWIRDEIGREPVALCYPFGYYDLETIGLVQAMGFRLGFTVDEGVSDARSWDAYGMKRFTVTRTETLQGFRRRLLSGFLPVTDIQPPPGSRVAGINTTVTVDVTDVPSNITNIKLRSGPSMKKARFVERDGRRCLEARIRKARLGFRVVSMSGTGPGGRRYYACWDLEMGDRSP